MACQPADRQQQEGAVYGPKLKEYNAGGKVTKHKKRNDPETWKRRIFYLKERLRTISSGDWTDRKSRQAHAAKVELLCLYKKLKLNRENKGVR